jgi:nucleoside-diphosphate-sugar epimerase
MVADPAGVIETSLLGTLSVLALAREKRVKGMVYLSSMEVYGLTDASLAFVTEADLGYIDLAAPRSCYPESKRMCENMCCSWLAQYGVPVKIARLARTFGAGARRDDPRVFAQFARDAAGGSDIVLHTEGASLGNYCYIADAVRGLFLLLLKGVSGEAYNIVNPDACMTIRAMAETVAAMYGVSVRVEPPRDIQSRGYLPDLTARLSADKIKGLGWQPRYGMEDMYKRMIDGWGMA